MGGIMVEMKEPDYYDFKGTEHFAPGVLSKIYEDCFGRKSDGLFVEVGAHDGTSWSHTYALVKLGWKGIHVEPVPWLAEQCRKAMAEFQGQTVVECACGDEVGTAELHYDDAQHGIVGGTLNPSVLPEGHRILKVPMRTLDDILDSEGVSPGFDLLSIDVEFGEMRVLAGFTLNMWHPKMVIIELCDGLEGPFGTFAKPARDYCETLFPCSGYRKVHFNPINTVFVRP